MRAGQADFRFVLPPSGRSAEIELKRTVGGRQSVDQAAWEAWITASGGLYAVARSEREVLAILVGWGVRLVDGPMARRFGYGD